MKQTISNVLKAMIVLVAIIFYLTGCYETHYYHHYNHHTYEWYDRHHTAPPAGVDFNVDIRNW